MAIPFSCGDESEHAARRSPSSIDAGVGMSRGWAVAVFFVFFFVFFLVTFFVAVGKLLPSTHHPAEGSEILS